jgi:hypothetical protein
MANLETVIMRFSKHFLGKLSEADLQGALDLSRQLEESAKEELKRLDEQPGNDKTLEVVLMHYRIEARRQTGCSWGAMDEGNDPRVEELDF